MEIDLPYLSAEVNRHGRAVLYVRRAGRRIRMTVPPGTPEFAAAYAAAVEQLGRPRPAPRRPERKPFPPGTLGWLAARYFASDEFRGLDARSQRTRRGVIEACLAEPHSDGDPEMIGFCPLGYVTARKIKRLRDLKAGRPGAANNRRKYLSALFGWALEHDPPLMATNPARDVRRVGYASAGFHSWTVDEVKAFEARHPVGSRARLALALLLYLGVRRGDVVALGRQHLRDGWISFVPAKTRHLRRRAAEKPVLPELAAVLAASPCGNLTFLVTAYGRPFSAAGFGAWFRARCDEAGLPGCTAHGLRKAGAALAAEHGATVHQLMAIFDWSTPGQAKVYTDAADRRRLAAEAMPLLARRTNRDG